MGVFTPFLIWVEPLIVGHFRTPAETGVYQAVSQTSTVFAIILSAFAAIFLPLIADLYHKKEFARLEELFRISTKWGLYISLPVFVMLCVFPREILIYVFDGRYARWLAAADHIIGRATGERRRRSHWSAAGDDRASETLVDPLGRCAGYQYLHELVSCAEVWTDRSRRQHRGFLMRPFSLRGIASLEH